MSKNQSFSIFLNYNKKILHFWTKTHPHEVLSTKCYTKLSFKSCKINSLGDSWYLLVKILKNQFFCWFFNNTNFFINKSNDWYDWIIRITHRRESKVFTFWFLFRDTILSLNKNEYRKIQINYKYIFKNSIHKI